MSECRALTNLSVTASPALWCRGGKANSITIVCTPISTRHIDPTDMETAVTTG